MKALFIQAQQKTAGFYAAAKQEAGEIKSQLKNVAGFVSDGCTGVPDLIFFPCCKDHDKDYSPSSTVPRLKADCKFYGCMKKRIKEKNWKKWWQKKLPSLYFIGVRLFGWLRYEGKPSG